MARRQRPEGEEEGADEALLVQELPAVDEVRFLGMLMRHRMESQPRRWLQLEVRRRPQAQRWPRVERVQQLDPVLGADVDPRHQQPLVRVAHPRAAVSGTGLETERSRPAS